VRADRAFGPQEALKMREGFGLIMEIGFDSTDIGLAPIEPT
jgi:hypothetical protein